MAAVRTFRELRVYRLAFETAMEVYQITKTFPKEEKYSLTDQLRRASRSVCGNIAEAWRKRRYPLSFVAKLADADGEAAEASVWLDFSQRCGFIDEETHRRLLDQYDHINAQLTSMIDRPESWCMRLAGKPSA